MSTPAVSSVRPTHQQQRVDSAFSCAFSCSWLKVCKRRGYCVLLVANLFQCAAVLVLEDHMIFLPLVTCWRYKIGSPPATTLSYYKSKASDSHQQHHHKGTLYPSAVECYKCVVLLGFRYTTFEALGSLPPLEETAQALVIKEAESEGGVAHKRRESISHFFRRKFSRKKDCKSQAL